MIFNADAARSQVRLSCLSPEGTYPGKRQQAYPLEPFVSSTSGVLSAPGVGFTLSGFLEHEARVFGLQVSGDLVKSSTSGSSSTTPDGTDGTCAEFRESEFGIYNFWYIKHVGVGTSSSSSTTIECTVAMFRVSGFGCRLQDSGFRVSGFGLRVSDFGFRVCLRSVKYS